MYKTLFLIFSMSLCLLMSCKQTNIENDLDIIPLPINCKLTSGSFTINTNTQIVVKEYNAANFDYAVMLHDCIQKQTGHILGVIEGYQGKTKNCIIFERSTNKQLTEEGYEIEITPYTIRLKATSKPGFYYALQSFLQMFPKHKDTLELSFQCLKLTDKPAFKFRGMQLDVSDHFFTVDFIKKYIDIISTYKFNKFHWLLSGNNHWRVEIKKYPELTEKEIYIDQNGQKMKQYYTQSEINEILQYASERCVEVIPEVKMPVKGMVDDDDYNHLFCFNKNSKYNNLCPGNIDSYNFVKDIFYEISNIFPGKYIYFPGELNINPARHLCTNCTDRMKELNFDEYKNIQTYFTSQITEYLVSRKKTVINDCTIPITSKINNLVFLTTTDSCSSIEIIDNNHKVIIAPMDYCDFRYYPVKSQTLQETSHNVVTLQRVYNFNILPTGIKPELINSILGSEGFVFTDNIDSEEQCEEALLPRALALSEVLWTKDNLRDWVGFKKRLDRRIVTMKNMKEGYRMISNR